MYVRALHLDPIRSASRLDRVESHTKKSLESFIVNIHLIGLIPHYLFGTLLFISSNWKYTVWNHQNLYKNLYNLVMSFFKSLKKPQQTKVFCNPWCFTTPVGPFTKTVAMINTRENSCGSLGGVRSRHKRNDFSFIESGNLLCYVRVYGTSETHTLLTFTSTDFSR